jgi:hypothetical protein
MARIARTLYPIQGLFPMLPAISPPSGVEGDDLIIGFDNGSGTHGLLKIREMAHIRLNSRGWRSRSRSRTRRR